MNSMLSLSMCLENIKFLEDVSVILCCCDFALINVLNYFFFSFTSMFSNSYVFTPTT